MLTALPALPLGKSRSPLKWFGSKGEHTPWLRLYMPNHHRFLDAFGGGGNVLLSKLRGSGAETLNDIDPELINFYRVLRDDGARLQQRLARLGMTVENGEAKGEVRRVFDSPAPLYSDDITRAVYYYVHNRASMYGESTAKRCYALRNLRKTKGEDKIRTYCNSILRLPHFTRRLWGVNLSNESYATAIPRFDLPTDLIYCDPPYPGAVRTCDRRESYRFEMLGFPEHEKLLRLLVKSNGMVMLSGYQCDLYNDLLRGWSKADKPHNCNLGRMHHPEITARQRRVETIWLNPLAREALSRRE